MVLLPASMRYVERDGRHSYQVNMEIGLFFVGLKDSSLFLRRYAALETLLEQLTILTPEVVKGHSGEEAQSSYGLYPQFQTASFGFSVEGRLETAEAKKIVEEALNFGKEICGLYAKHLNTSVHQEVVDSDLSLKWEK
jgi:hypothetical protein